MSPFAVEHVTENFMFIYGRTDQLVEKMINKLKQQIWSPGPPQSSSGLCNLQK